METYEMTMWDSGWLCLLVLLWACPYQETVSLCEPNPSMTWRTMDIAIVAGVITAVAFFLVGLLLLMLHYMYRHKGTYHTHEDKGTEFAENTDAALQGDLSLQDAAESHRKEYFI